jgi:hypothetical protein
MLGFSDETGLDEVGITPGKTADQGELISAHGLGFILGDSEVLG